MFCKIQSGTPTRQKSKKKQRIKTSGGVFVHTVNMDSCFINCWLSIVWFFHISGLKSNKLKNPDVIEVQFNDPIYSLSHKSSNEYCIFLYSMVKLLDMVNIW